MKFGFLSFPAMLMSKRTSWKVIQRSLGFET